jgi:hypothetical protein
MQMMAETVSPHANGNYDKRGLPDPLGRFDRPTDYSSQSIRYLRTASTSVIEAMEPCAAVKSDTARL